MRKRIRCKWHSEETPSLVQRKDGWFCFGVCNRLYTNKQVEEKTGEHYEYEEDDECQENLEDKFAYIESLPRCKIRGLEFPSDSGGYYICWPDKAYYKYRLFNPGKSGKYLSPKGHHPTPFWGRKRMGGTLYLCEGEINALSLSLAFTGDSVCSLGSASCFNSATLNKLLTTLKEYSNVVVVLDNDPAGIKGYIEAKATFLYKLPFIKYILLKPDPNEILVEKGTSGLREALRGADYR